MDSALSFLQTLSPPHQALAATIFTWGLTALGASLVLFTRGVSSRLLSAAQGLAAGVMLAASFWSLLSPALEMAEAQGMVPWIPAAVGLLLGAAFVAGIDKVLPHLHPGFARDQAEGVPVRWSQGALLLAAMTIHNLPEGMAVGVSFGGAGQGVEGATLGSAMALALGIGLQNLPEGLAVALPLYAAGLSRWRAFMFGQASALVEPVGGYFGALFVVNALPFLPYALSFAAGAMIFVVIEELIPESQRSGHTDLATLAALGGFVGMMILDVALG
ncbi:ZIP family metal transporter [Deinococcus piscis]|uniref:ZIP family metal transporter n=1 Tax=Deinococcus piscis TaxID=394230 RepID=A0ABQ3K555_9DEIO|nr:ZIP family metal transporter [Deinococcus piscis]GHG02726.1 ZIP family metal transporter [Deinococcus piscis]